MVTTLLLLLLVVAAALKLRYSFVEVRNLHRLRSDLSCVLVLLRIWAEHWGDPDTAAVRRRLLAALKAPRAGDDDS